MTVASLTLFRFDAPTARLWALCQMLLARPALAALPGIGFHKLLGAGFQEGFHPRPSTSVCAILAVWPSLSAARGQVGGSAVYRRYRERAEESWTAFLAPARCRGQWDGTQPFGAVGTQGFPAGEPIAVLTRASLRARSLLDFWGQVPGIVRTIPADDSLRCKIGLGEIPWLHQVTFTVWDDADALAAFARGGPHGAAASMVREHGWFKESLFARFRVLETEGEWRSFSPAPYSSGAPSGSGPPS